MTVSERLTVKCVNGDVWLLDSEGNPHLLSVDGDDYNNAFSRLADYEEIGTVEDFKAIKQWKSDIIESFSKYDVNSVDELIKCFRELTEKAAPKKPIYSEFDENEIGEIIPYKATCPTCGFEFEFGTWNDEENHHCKCGQRMNWKRKEQRWENN